MDIYALEPELVSCISYCIAISMIESIVVGTPGGHLYGADLTGVLPFSIELCGQVLVLAER
jgi:hypothetical protein